MEMGHLDSLVQLAAGFNMAFGSLQSVRDVFSKLFPGSLWSREFATGHPSRLSRTRSSATREAPAALRPLRSHKWRYGVSGCALHSAWRRPRSRPAPTGGYPPRASHFLGGQRTPAF